MKPTVFIIDDDEAMRDSLGLLMRSVGINYETYSNAQSFLENYEESRSGCLLLDIRMPGMSGLDLQQKLQEMDAELPILFITGHGDVPMAVEAMKKGAVDFFQKPFRDQALLDRISQVMTQLNDNQKKQAERQQIRSRLERLTARENEILNLVVQGVGNKVIAADLGISQRTVELHRAHVMQKMQADSLAQLVQMVMLTEQ
ncbi:MAG: response regulator transcription factor [Pseudomonadales bacterium]